MSNKSFTFVSPLQASGLQTCSHFENSIPLILCQILVTLSKFTSPFTPPSFYHLFLQEKRTDQNKPLANSLKFCSRSVLVGFICI